MVRAARKLRFVSADLADLDPEREASTTDEGGRWPARVARHDLAPEAGPPPREAGADLKSATALLACAALGLGALWLVLALARGLRRR